MKRNKQKVPQPRQLKIRYDEARQGWVIEADAGRSKVFSTHSDAENYCITKLHQCPITVGPITTRHQELPNSSVWTGAPWDHSFGNVQ